MHAENNPASKLTNYIEAEIRAFSEIPLDQKLTEEQDERLYQLKQGLAVVHGLEGRSPAHVARQLRRIRDDLATGTFDPTPYYNVPAKESEKSYTAGDLYLNSKVQDLFNAAEVERQDYRKVENPPNIFFGKERQYRFPVNSEEPWFAITLKTLQLNLIAMITFIVVAFFALRASLKKQLSKV